MIVIYINGEGTAEKLSPQHVYQGSNQTGVTVFAPVPTTTAMGIAFKLPDGTSTPYYPMTFIQSVEGLSQYEFILPTSITQLAGQASIALQAIYSDGQQTSQLIEFEIEPSVIPDLPGEIDQSAYDIIMQRLQEDRADITTLQGQIGNIEELSKQAQKASANAVETANEAKETADGLADSIAQANDTARQAVDTANGAVEDIAQFKQDVNEEITQFENATDSKIEDFQNTVNGQVANIELTANGAVDTANEAKSTAYGLADSIAQANSTAGEAKEIAEEALEQSKITGTKVNIDGQFATEINFDSDPQGQLNGKVNKSGDTMTGNLKLDQSLLSKQGDNPIFVLPMVPHEEIDPTHNTRTYFMELLKWICRNYPNVEGGTWIGRAAPNSRGICMLSIYDTNRVNSEGLPEYSEGFWQSISVDNINYFATNSYVYQYLSLSDTYARRIDPTKLEPTTANGWTVGSINLGFSEEGIYMVSINGITPFIIIISTAILEGNTNAFFVAGYNISSGMYGRVLYVLGSWVWNASRSKDNTAIDITSVAYKKIA